MHCIIIILIGLGLDDALEPREVSQGKTIMIYVVFCY